MPGCIVLEGCKPQTPSGLAVEFAEPSAKWKFRVLVQKLRISKW